VFELQDSVAISVAGVIEPALQAAEARRSAHRPTNDLTAYDLYLRALPTLPRRRGRELAKRSICSNRQSPAIRAMARRSLWQRCACRNFI